MSDLFNKYYIKGDLIMKLTRCNNGHFYDADKYQDCPHCSNQGKTQPLGDPTGPGVTLPINPNPPIKETQPAVVSSNSSKGETLKKEVDDVQKTVGMFNVKEGGSEPVAGWLVCTKGPHFGEDFRIKMGKNFIGRLGNMDIVLSKDSSVSREKHLVVLYDPKGNMFIVQSGESKELSYLNDKVILSPQELNPYDVITLGSSELLFVPLCSDSFKWEAVKKEEEK